MIYNFFKKTWIIIFLLGVVITCTNKRDKADVSGVQIDSIKIKRYGKDLFAVDPGNVGNGLNALYDDYSFFLGEDYRDTLNIIRIRNYIIDPLLKQLFYATMEKYPDLTDVEIHLTEAFRHIKYYFPETTVPDVYTYISGIDVMQPVIFFDSVMIIGLDCYLGKDFEEYKNAGIPVYRASRMEEEYIVPDCIKAWASYHYLPEHPGNQLLDQIIAEGKILYLLDILLPEVPDHIKIGFSQEQIQWCEDNEPNLWAFLLENEMLFSSDLQKTQKLLQDGPFTSFFSKESPARTGIWMGWQIVRSYMDKNDITPEQLMEIGDARDILSGSGYKP